jgi:hypothetical protein
MGPGKTDRKDNLRFVTFIVNTARWPFIKHNGLLKASISSCYQRPSSGSE